MGELYDRARPPYPPALFRQLDNHFNFKTGETTLEIGCATGKATEHLAARGLTVTGIDIAPDLLAVANGKLKGWKVRLLQSSFEDFKAPNASFNFRLWRQHAGREKVGSCTLDRCLRHQRHEEST